MSKPTTRAEAKPQSPFKLPYRGGSINFRHGRWWLVYTDADGDLVQRNSNTVDPKAAFRQLVISVIEVYKARLDGLRELKRQLDETKEAAGTEGRGEAGEGGQQPARRRSVSQDSARGGRRDRRAGGQK